MSRAKLRKRTISTGVAACRCPFDVKWACSPSNKTTANPALVSLQTEPTDPKPGGSDLVFSTKQTNPCRASTKWLAITVLTISMSASESRMSCLIKGQLHLVAAEVLVIQLLEPSAQLFVIVLVTGGGHHLGGLQNLVVHKDRTIQA